MPHHRNDFGPWNVERTEGRLAAEEMAAATARKFFHRGGVVPGVAQGPGTHCGLLPAGRRARGRCVATTRSRRALSRRAPASTARSIWNPWELAVSKPRGLSAIPSFFAVGVLQPGV